MVIYIIRVHIHPLSVRYYLSLQTIHGVITNARIYVHVHYIYYRCTCIDEALNVMLSGN